MTNTAQKIHTGEIVPNDCPKEREDRRGCVRTSYRRTWIVNVDGEFRDEYRTLREARDALARLEAL